MKYWRGFSIAMILALIASVLPLPGAAAMPGGVGPASLEDPWVIEAAAFAVRAQEQAMREKPEGPSFPIFLVAILEARQQVVAGVNFYLSLRVEVNGAQREADVVIWRQLSGTHKLTAWKWR